ncbi:MAG TPA: 3-oxoacyl-[acyl-carrier-protein] synthase III C-terminal domain-containing protein [Kofleriaceae bacterium]
MGTCIEAVATAHERGRLFGRGALHLSDVAATTCLSRAHREPDDLDLLINAGLYKDGNAAEPALATIIQEDIGANPIANRLHKHGTFAFDVLNGGCGVVTAAQIADGFLTGGSARYALIVAGDVDPSPRTSQRFPFSPAGGAMLLSHTDDSSQFRAFDIRTFPEHAELFEATLHWQPHAGWLRRGRNVVEVDEDPAFAFRCVDLAHQVATDVIARHGLAASDIDLLIASQYPRAFAPELARRLGLPDDRVPRVRAELASAHTAGPLAALETAFTTGQFMSARNTLFVTAGAGITIGVALYTRDESGPMVL